MIKKKIAVFISGKGSNLLSLIDAASENDFPGSINLVISDNSKASGLNHARNNRIRYETIEYQKCINKKNFEQQILNETIKENIDIICLAGFMRILSEKFIISFNGPIINIHPSLLPAYKGLNTHQRVLEAKETHHGTSVHFVIPELDGGPIVIQYRIKIHSSDTADTLKKRVQEEEYQHYSKALKWFALDQLEMKNNKVMFHGDHLDKPILIEET